MASSESLPCDCKVYLCTVVNLLPAALPLSTCWVRQGSGSEVGSHHLLLGEDLGSAYLPQWHGEARSGADIQGLPWWSRG